MHQKIKSRDHRKNVWALDKGFRLIRIRFDEDISDILIREGVMKANPPSPWSSHHPYALAKSQA